MWTAALILNILHLAYHQVTTNFDFFPFNNIRHYKPHERIAEAGVNALTMGFPIVALLWRNHTAVIVACCVLGFLLFGEFISWWPAYFWGTHPSMNKWQEVYDRAHKHTIKFLPPIKDHPIPNLEHCILNAITIITFTVTFIYCFQLPS